MAYNQGEVFIDECDVDFRFNTVGDSLAGLVPNDRKRRIANEIWRLRQAGKRKGGALWWKSPKAQFPSGFCHPANTAIGEERFRVARHRILWREKLMQKNRATKI
jgi:hypothetical protein